MERCGPGKGMADTVEAKRSGADGDAGKEAERGDELAVGGKILRSRLFLGTESREARRLMAVPEIIRSSQPLSGSPSSL